jgi:type I pantothenate kinase
VPRVKTVFSPNLSPYRAFSREEWASLRADAPLTLNAQDVVQLQSLNDPISIQEVEAIYLPLSRLLSLHVTAMQRLFKSRSHFLGVEDVKMPFIIGIAGSVSSGKSTTSRILKALLGRWPNSPKVDLVTTDGFLKPNAQLVDEGLMEKKGFPESYDIAPLLAFLSAVKAGKKATASIYSHLIYDRVEGQGIGVDRPDILIVEGLNVLQTGRAPKGGQAIPFVSDFFDFSIYIDAEEALLEKWYVERFLRLRETAFKDPTSYFKRYALLSDEAACETALHLWRSINLVNLHDNILPTRQRADLILKKGAAHLVENVQLRRL